MIRKLISCDREKLLNILQKTENFNEEEIKIALELIDICLTNENQKDYEVFVDCENEEIRGYICFGPRPLTEQTYDLYWIAVNPVSQSKGIGTGLVEFMENLLKKKNARLVLIETSGKDSYEKERRFYEKISYSKLAEIKDFYSLGDSLIVYGKYF